MYPSTLYSSIFQLLFPVGNLKISILIPRNPLPVKTHIGQENLIAGSEIKLLLIIAKKCICKEFLYNPAYILKK
jgi:hypothetical protein